MKEIITGYDTHCENIVVNDTALDLTVNIVYSI